IAAGIDLLPTLADLTGVRVVSTNALDGISLKPLLTSSATKNKTSWPDRMIFSNWRGRVSLRTQRFHLDRFGELFDMTVDPGQRHNVTEQHRQVAARLSKHRADNYCLFLGAAV
ncbi:MAG: N-acetylgalactosamine 6-sulfate sulfatase, partial [Planctomycetaceae bacterium]